MRHQLGRSWSEGGTCLVFLLFSIKLPSDGSSISCPVLSLPERNAVSSCFYHLKSKGGGAVAVHPETWIEFLFSFFCPPSIDAAFQLCH